MREFSARARSRTAMSRFVVFKLLEQFNQIHIEVVPPFYVGPSLLDIIGVALLYLSLRSLSDGDIALDCVDVGQFIAPRDGTVIRPILVVYARSDLFPF